MKASHGLLFIIGIVVGWFLHQMVAMHFSKETDSFVGSNENNTSNLPGHIQSTVSALKNTTTSADDVSITAISQHKKFPPLEQLNSWSSYASWLEHFNQNQPHSDKDYLLQARAALELTKDYRLVFTALLKAIEVASDVGILAKSLNTLDSTIDDYAKIGQNRDGIRKYQQNLEFLHEKIPANALSNLALAKLMAYQGDIDQAFIYLELVDPNSPHQIEVSKFRDLLEKKSHNFDNSKSKIALTRLGNQFIVEAYFGATPLRLLLDTGASSTIVNVASANELMSIGENDFVFTGKTTQISTANGITMSRIFLLKRFQIEEFSLDNIQILDAPMGGADYFDGLLGMDFLGSYDFKIDRENAFLIIDNSSR